jgi:hypothetical protein
MLKYQVRLAVERVQRNKFLKMLGEKRYNTQLLANNAKFTSFVFRMPIELLQTWILEDPRLKDVASSGGQ